MDRVLVTARVSKYPGFCLSPSNVVSSEQTVVIVDSGYATFAILQSVEHDAWLREYQSSLETRGRYTPSDCFETFPFPPYDNGLATIGRTYYEHRSR